MLPLPLQVDKAWGAAADRPYDPWLSPKGEQQVSIAPHCQISACRHKSILEMLLLGKGTDRHAASCKYLVMHSCSMQYCRSHAGSMPA